MDSFSLDTLEASLTSIQIQKHFREFDHSDPTVPYCLS